MVFLDDKAEVEDARKPDKIPEMLENVRMEHTPVNKSPADSIEFNPHAMDLNKAQEIASALNNFSFQDSPHDAVTGQALPKIKSSREIS